jgi:peptide/nickel transport system substrate-binding protein
MIDGTLVTAKGGNLADITSVATTGPLTVVVRTKQPDASLLFNLSDGLFGVVEKGAGREEGLHPVGTGPFRFVSQMQDKGVVLERNAGYWAVAPKIERVRFEVVPDTITAALEMRKGSADVESNVLTPDMVHALRRERNVVVQSGPGAIVMYANFNVQDPKLRDPRVRQAIAYAIDRPALIAALWRGEAQIANTLLPSGHWAAASDAELPQYPHDVARAVALLDAAELKPDKNGIRLRFTLKTSTDETTRLVAQAMQQELRAAGIDLSLRSAEFGTFYSDVTRGAFQMYLLRWIGSNEDPGFLRYVFASSSFPPKGGNRGRYSNAQIDSLLAQANAETDEAARRREYVEVQQILSRDLPSIPLWYPNNEVVHSARVIGVKLDPGGTFDFLRTAELH